MDAPKKFQVPDSLTNNHSLRKLSLIYSSINDSAILGWLQWSQILLLNNICSIYFQRSIDLIWWVWVGGVYSGLVYHDPIRVEMHKSQLVNTAQSVLTMRLQRCLSWSVTLQDKWQQPKWKKPSHCSCQEFQNFWSVGHMQNYKKFASD